MKDYSYIDGFATMEEQGELFKKICKDGMKVAEVGVYKGRMTAMILGMFGFLEYHCIDHFQGSEEHERRDYFPDFAENISGIKDVRVQVGDSVGVSKKYPDFYFDIVYLDASHDYLSVKQDIEAWWPKVKVGGVLCGDDYIIGWDGVIQAVDEAFGDKVKRVAGQQWYVVKK